MIRGRSLSELPDLCSFITVVPILSTHAQFSSYETIRKLLEAGFELHWSVECKNCVGAGDFCFLNVDTLTCPENTCKLLFLHKQ
ncbi:hypothetical protein Pint_22133 [Pistacia integerrima]|uniref:Uncharacterized protein n=1 Tax=Pistacia integerrima TaxID=434235 RepID=A0ACC0YM40_9ROSI|nr:hypothetical protein Pint_22133 [Pistacia integerrima]